MAADTASSTQPSAAGNAMSCAAGRDAFRQAVVSTLERRLFYKPALQIFGGAAGLYDYGPPGCAVKSNFLSFWRQFWRQRNSLVPIAPLLGHCRLSSKTLVATMAAEATATSGNAAPSAEGREAFRKAVESTLKSRLFYIPAFGIYGGAEDFYDYGPLGCALESNIISLWRQVILPPIF
ncbi:Glycine--tRNA ligase [Carex littledalei]|uniref:Glycine--tRNA ligase n=1 Tax=Carex littledalei TaxID=544730 RepID=A0A833R4C5_9POAL|nr:Glycine--tRNA ligase [Carex littledalei]